MTNNDLEATLAPFRTIMVKPSPTDKEKSELEHLGLNYSTVMLAQLPLISSSKTHLGLDATQLAGELAFYVLVIWWLLALRYARKLWPKPDNSRCRHCKYPTAGLTTPTCPECGNHTQTHGS